MGSIVFEEDYFGLSKYVYNLTFSEDFTEIFRGVRHGFNRKGELMDSESHQTGGLTAYEYIIHHEIAPKTFDMRCQVIQQESYIENIDNMIIFYSMNEDQFKDNKEQLKIIRDSNETAI